MGVTGTKLGRFNEDSEELDLRFEGDSDEAELRELLWYEDPTGYIWFALPGQHTDGASIPRILWSIMGHPWKGVYRRAAILHDAYYRIQYPGITRAAIDRMLYQAIRCEGGSVPLAFLVYTGVRCGGWLTWARRARHPKQEQG